MVFTHEHKSDGKLGTGVLPNDLHETTKSILKTFMQAYPLADKTTFHVWFKDLPRDLQDKVYTVQKHPFWKSLCTKPNCVFKNVHEMDEIYVSKTPNTESRGILYGATSNYDLHRDGAFTLPGIRFYRILVGLTDGNSQVKTSFPNFQQSVFLNKDVYIIFDFDRALHEVVKLQASKEFRVMLKLHFCVCEDKCVDNTSYLQFAITCYTLYERITRYIMETGTEPSTLYEFVWGLLAFVSVKFPWVLLLYVVLISSTLVSFLLNWKIAHLLQRLSVDVICVFSLVVLFLWIRFKLFGIR